MTDAPRISAVVGTVLMLLMYSTEWPFAANAASTNPLVENHLTCALALIVVALQSAGNTWGFGGWRERLPGFRKAPWLI